MFNGTLYAVVIFIVCLGALIVTDGKAPSDDLHKDDHTFDGRSDI